MIFNITFPQIQIDKISNEGILKKSITIPKSFISNNKNTLFSPVKSIPLTAYHKNILDKKKGFILELLFHGFNFSARRLKLNRLKYSCSK